MEYPEHERNSKHNAADLFEVLFWSGIGLVDGRNLWKICAKFVAKVAAVFCSVYRRGVFRRCVNLGRVTLRNTANTVLLDVTPLHGVT